MTSRTEIRRILNEYDLSNLTIGTLGSHSALNIFKGAKDEGFKTVCICKESDTIVYEKFQLVDKVILVEDFSEMLSEKVQEKLRKLNTVLIPHGSFTAYLSTEEITNSLFVPIFGNRELLHWEANRENKKNGCIRQTSGYLRPLKNQKRSTVWLLPSFLELGAEEGIFWQVLQNLFTERLMRWLTVVYSAKKTLRGFICRNTL